MPSFHIHNGEIRSEIHLAAALRYFAGGSYLDITISHQRGKTDVYHSIWAVVHATNRCLCLQFPFPATAAECQEIAVDFTFRSKAHFDNCVGCIDGMLLWTENLFQKNVRKLVLTVVNFIAAIRQNSALTYKEFVMPIAGSHTYLYNILYRHLTTYLLLHLHCTNNWWKDQDSPTDNVSMETMPMSTKHICLSLFPNTSSGPWDAYNYYQSQL